MCFFYQEGGREIYCPTKGRARQGYRWREYRSESKRQMEANAAETKMKKKRVMDLVLRGAPFLGDASS